jgi:hypothetical protein
VEQDVATLQCSLLKDDPSAVCCFFVGGPCTIDADCCGGGVHCDDITRKCFG